jgi:hypothetical protein
MKPIRRLQSQTLLRAGYKPNRIIRIRPATKLNIRFYPVRFGVKPKMITHEYETD